jgi:hypothetical protein
LSSTLSIVRATSSRTSIVLLNVERAWTSGSWLQYSSEDSLFLHPNCLLPSCPLHTQQILNVGITLRQFVKKLLPRHHESTKWHLRL